MAFDIVQVHCDSDQRDDEDGGAGDRGGCDQSRDALVDDEQSEHQQRRAVELGGEDLGAFQAEGHGALGGALGEADRDQRQADRGRVGEHVRGV